MKFSLGSVLSRIRSLIRLTSDVINRASVVPAMTLLEDELVLEIAKVHGKTAAQILLRHSVQHNIIVIPKSVSQKRIAENFDVFYKIFIKI